MVHESAAASSTRTLREGKTSRRERETPASPRGRRGRGRPAQTDRFETKEKKERLAGKRPGPAEEKDGMVKCSVVDVDSVMEHEGLDLLETEQQDDGVKQRNLGVCEWILVVLVLALVLLFLPISIWFCIKVVREHERAVIFRLGHLLRGRARGPGLLFHLPFLDVCHTVDIRLKMLQVPPHSVVSRDVVRVELGAVCYYRIENPLLCSSSLAGVTAVVRAVVQGAVRDILAQQDFSHILLDRRRIAQEVQLAADSVVCRWGIRVEKAELEELTVPAELQRRLTAEAEGRALLKVDLLSASLAAAQPGLLRLLHQLPAMLLPLPANLLSMTSDLSVPCVKAERARAQEFQSSLHGYGEVN
ncbi:podocin [Lampris incognitus]|uniref:podocin n=1 Tax=Lampris incognitus TaxID=2546036 RepID=UPI0024B5BCA9|nr:podocin [Lampris incognitus]